MSAKLDIGRSYSLQSRVEEWMTAEKSGNKGVDVLSTAVLVQLVETAAIHCIEPILSAGQVTSARISLWSIVSWFRSVLSSERRSKS